MKAHKDAEKAMASIAVAAGAQNRALPRFLVWLILFVSVTYVVYTLKLVSNSRSACDSDDPLSAHRRDSSSLSPPAEPDAPPAEPDTTIPLDSGASERKQVIPDLGKASEEVIENRKTQASRTEIGDIVFGIAASSKLWDQRKSYIKLWYKPEAMRGIVWLDKAVKASDDEGLPPVRISGDTSQFAYKNRQGHRSAIRISRIVSETLRIGGSAAEGVKWFVMGDDDTVFVTENLIRVLNKYDHNQFYYIGSSSESHLQNIYFSYGMAYGGGGFAISYPLAMALEKMQDRCIQRYPGLYGSDDRIQACMAELGVPLTRELGFHQYDVYGNLFGLLAAHPVTPLVSLHHLDVVEPIFPNVTRLQALERLTVPMKLDSASILQQSICYDREKSWTVSVSWGFAVQIFRGVFSHREIEMPSRTFLNWYRRADYTAYAFNTRPVSRNPCQKPFVFYFSGVLRDGGGPDNQTVSEYVRHRVPNPACRWKMANPGYVNVIRVHKRLDPELWDRAPRRNCCRVLESKKARVVVDVGVCGDGEISEV